MTQGAEYYLIDEEKEQEMRNVRLANELHIHKSDRNDPLDQILLTTDNKNSNSCGGAKSIMHNDFYVSQAAASNNRSTDCRRTLTSANCENEHFYSSLDFQNLERNVHQPLSDDCSSTTIGEDFASKFIRRPFSSNPNNGNLGALEVGEKNSSMRLPSCYATTNRMIMENSNTTNAASQQSSSSRSLILRRSYSSSKAPSQTLKWLMDNFEGAEGVSLPRATLFALYMNHCNENDVEPMNAASFGKMIRSIFSGLKTRRLGTRGNSKYHYYGIKLKQNSSLQRRVEDISNQFKNFGSLKQLEKRQRCTSQKHLMTIKSIKNDFSAQRQKQEAQKHSQRSANSSLISGKLAAMKQPVLPDLDFDKIQLKDNSLIQKDFDEFRQLYHEHLEASIAAINSGRFEYISSIWNAFWRHPSFDKKNSSFKLIEDRLSTEIFFKLCEEPSILDFVYQSDNLFFDKYAEYIFPSIINSLDDFALINLRNGTTLLPNIIAKSTIHLPAGIMSAKNHAKDNFLSYIKDIVSISQSTGAVKNVFRSKTCLNQTIKDFDSLDFNDIDKRLFDLFPLSYINFRQFKEIIETFFANKFENISNDSIVEDLLMSLRSLIDLILCVDQSNEYVMKLRQLYVQWCLFSSMVLRELTLQSASSFGVFQILKTLLDDFLMHNIRITIAKLSNSPVLSALRDISSFEQQFPS